jgi:O-acetylhomoserine (thiol)-lyase
LHEHAAQVLALFPLMSPGAEIVASSRLYGGSLQQMRNTYPKFGWAAKIIDADDPENFKRAVTANTKAFFIESLANPGGVISDIEASPASPRRPACRCWSTTRWRRLLCKPIDYSATLIVHSTTSFKRHRHLDGRRGRRLASSTSQAASSGLPARTCLSRTHSSRASAAVHLHSHAVGLRDLGPGQAVNAWLTMLG